jgi:hypothetical protein
LSSTRRAANAFTASSADSRNASRRCIRDNESAAPASATGRVQRGPQSLQNLASGGLRCWQNGQSEETIYISPTTGPPYASLRKSPLLS